jgi:hypothetical protein
MANGRLRCLGSAQHLKNKFGKGFQIELKHGVVEQQHTDYISIATFLRSTKDISIDDEEAPPEESIFFNLEEAVAALRALTGDSYLSDMVSENNEFGCIVWKEATSPGGCSLEELTAFATGELRMRNIEDFMRENYANYILRERQESKARFEISSENVRVSSIFAKIEANKECLRLSDYSVSQTSLEQVFNTHAAEAERLKQGQIDG